MSTIGNVTKNYVKKHAADSVKGVRNAISHIDDVIDIADANVRISPSPFLKPKKAPSVFNGYSSVTPKSIPRPQVGPVLRNSSRTHDAFDQGKKNFNKIEINQGEGFYKKIWEDAKKIDVNNITNKFDDYTGLKSFYEGFGEAGEKYEGGAISKAAQNAGYMKKDAQGKNEFDYKKIAMGYMGASTVARVATGGGLYKDGEGNTNIMGLPLI